MMSETDRRSKALGEAIQFEVDGREFFLKAAAQTKSYFGRLMFESIAEDELGHMKRIREIHDRCSSSGKWVSPSHASGTKSLESVFQQAKRELPQRVTVGTDEMAAVRLGIQMEQKGHLFYSRLAEEASEEVEKDFYRQLAEEESRHGSILQDMERVLMQAGGLD